MSKLPRSAFCPTCKYNLAGHELDETFHVRCSECGDYIKPISAQILNKRWNEQVQTFTITVILLTSLFILGIIAIITLFLAVMIPAFNF